MLYFPFFSLYFYFLFLWKMLRFYQTMKMFGQEPSISVQKCSLVGVVAGMLCVPVLPCELTFLPCPHLSWCSVVPPSCWDNAMCHGNRITMVFCEKHSSRGKSTLRTGWDHNDLQWQPLGDTVRRFPSWIPRLVITWHKAILLLLKGKFSTEKDSNGKFQAVPEEVLSNPLCIVASQFNLASVGLLCCLCLISNNRGRAPFRTNTRPGEADIHY